MSYRGEDLDLRTSQTWSSNPAELGTAIDPAGVGNGPRSALRSGPVWVDDTVLTVANYAYDIALAHRAGEVYLEHLLHALTRIDVAAEALEARGVRVAALRRESATIIASEIPVGLSNGKGSPRRSDEFAEILRFASAQAGRRNEAADVDDLVQAMLDRRSEFQGLALLARHSRRVGYREPIETLAPSPRFAAEPRYSSAPVERYARPLAERSAESGRYVSDLARSTRHDRAELDSVTATTDLAQISRIDALEQMIQALRTDLATERQVVGELLRDLSRDTQGQRDDHGRWQSGLYDRFEALERVVTEARSGSARDGATDGLAGLDAGLDRRLADIETAVRQTGEKTGGVSIDAIRQAIDLQPLSHRLDVIEEAVLSRDADGRDSAALRALEAGVERGLSSLNAQTDHLEALLSGASLVTGGDASPIADRLAALNDGLDAHQRSLHDRMDAVERAIAAEIETAGAKHQAYAKDLNEVHDAIMKLNQNQHTLAGTIDQWRTDLASDVNGISTRLANLDADNERPIQTLNALTDHMDTMNRLIIERYHRRNRFWYWLFGTDDWIGRSWPSQATALESEKATLKAPAS